MVAFSTSHFRDSIHELCRRPKHQYTSCKKDICEELAGKTAIDVADIKNNGRLHDNGVKCVLKVRVRNSIRNIGKSGAFRVISVIDREKDEIVFMYIYPKTGALAKESLSNDFTSELLKVYLSEREGKSLVRLDLDNELAEIIEAEEENIEITNPEL